MLAPICRRASAVAVLALVPSLAAGAAAGDSSVRAKIYSAFAGVKSYRLTVLGSVRSLGVWVAPNKYQITSEIEGKPIKTIIVGNDYWTFSGGKWEKSGTISSNLDVDIAGLLRKAKADRGTPFVKLPEEIEDSKRVGTFQYTFQDGTEETCNYDLRTYRVTRCKTPDVTLLYSGYNDPANTVAIPK